MDFTARGRLSSPHMTFTVTDGLPFPRYSLEHPVVQEVAPVVLRLTCTSPEMTPYWNAMSEFGWCDPVPDGTVPPSALVDPAARADARAQLDAIVATKVFGLTRDELAYVLDQFPVLAKRELKEHGTFVTRDRVLAWFDTITDGEGQ